MEEKKNVVTGKKPTVSRQVDLDLAIPMYPSYQRFWFLKIRRKRAMGPWSNGWLDFLSMFLCLCGHPHPTPRIQHLEFFFFFFFKRKKMLSFNQEIKQKNKSITRSKPHTSWTKEHSFREKKQDQQQIFYTQTRKEFQQT